MLLQATRQADLAEDSSVGGMGGAITLGSWGSTIEIHNSTFVWNAARQFGGAVHALAFERSRIRLQRVNATFNWVGPSRNQADPLIRTLRCEGAAVHVQGSDTRVELIWSVITHNRFAGRVGASLMLLP
jgi:hypothetical protein